MQTDDLRASVHPHALAPLTTGKWPLVIE